LTGTGNTRTASCSSSTLAAGSHSVVATYSGDATNAGSSNAPLTQVIQAAATTTTLTSSLNPAPVGSSVTFTANVSGTNPSGSVSCTADGSALSGCSTVAVTGSGNTRTASCNTNSLAVGSHSVVATYSGDASNASSSNAPLTQIIQATAVSSITTLTSSLNPATVGASVTFTASISGSNPSGSVSFIADGSALSGCSGVILTGSGNTRTASCNSSSLAVGSHSVVASYSGDAGNAPSSNAPLTQVIQVATTTTLTSSLNPALVGVAVTFTATVTGVAPGGSVKFTADGSTAISGCDAVPLVGSEDTRTAVCSSSLAVGSHVIIAEYSGDAGNAGSSNEP